MKLTKQRLKEIIAEEISLLSEIDNNQAQIATAQHLASTAASAQDQVNHVNNSRDDDILEQIHNLAQDMNKFISGLDDGSKKGALAAAVANVLNLAAEIEAE
jgi:hypothetical protein